MATIPELFGSLVFNDSVMKQRLPKDTYKALQKTVSSGEALDPTLANTIAAVMKDWAIEKGATHYTHWFQPMTGITAEKHDSFITPCGDGTIIMNFSGKELNKGEPDASSFPSGGLRSTFEARGYTAWDSSSYAFIKDGTLCIPTAFISYGGEVLDKKTPLLRSMNAVNKQVERFLALFNKTAKYINITVGCEQEYFLVDKKLFDARKDLSCTGRTLIGSRPLKGQELEDHYFGTIKPRVIAYMQELDEELWKLGITSKTRHNEVAPAQHEMAPIFTAVNVATDHNQLTMEVMKKVADRHGLACLLHEKPFAGVNGSGKHNNWSVSTSEGENLLDPGKTPENNLQFMLFLASIIQAVDEHQDLLRLSVASAGNDHRLGANEAPPAIISMFLGGELTDILEAITAGKAYKRVKTEKMDLGVDALAVLNPDATDRNRTSPFAFTGNKFEFRMLGSALNVACPNIMLNTAVADSLDKICTMIENAGVSEKSIKKAIADVYTAHKRVVFNGNNYSEEWQEEAAKRGLLNLKTTPIAVPYYSREENIAMFEKFGVYNAAEVKARQEILLENYCKVINIEALALLSMTTKDVLPACFTYMNQLSSNITAKSALGVTSEAEKALLTKIASLADSAYASKVKLEEVMVAAKECANIEEEATYFHDVIFMTMQEVRVYCDELETFVSKELWPFPTYSDLLFSV